MCRCLQVREWYSWLGMNYGFAVCWISGTGDGGFIFVALPSLVVTVVNAVLYFKTAASIRFVVNKVEGELIPTMVFFLVWCKALQKCVC